MIKRHLLLISLLLLSLIVFFTHPGELNFLVLTVPFILIFIAVYSLCRLVLKKLKWMQNGRLGTLISAILAITVVVALMLQSLGQLDLKDFLLISSLAIGIMWYLKMGLE